MFGRLFFAKTFSCLLPLILEITVIPMVSELRSSRCFTFAYLALRSSFSSRTLSRVSLSLNSIAAVAAASALFFGGFDLGVGSSSTSFESSRSNSGFIFSDRYRYQELFQPDVEMARLVGFCRRQEYRYSHLRSIVLH